MIRHEHPRRISDVHDWENPTLSDFAKTVYRHAMTSASDIAVVDDSRSWRYIDLVAGAMYLSQQLESISSKPHIGILLPTSGAFPMGLLACWMIRRVAIPVNYLLAEEERQYIIKDSEIDTLITSRKMIDFLGAEPKGVKLLYLEDMDFSGIPPLRWPARNEPDDIAVILYTSGTSGRPKGVMLSHGNLSDNVKNTVTHTHLKKGDVFLGVLPQFHSFGLTALTLLPLYLGTKVVYTARFMPKKLHKLIKDHKPHFFVAIPSMYNALTNLKDATPDDFKSIQVAASGGEPLPKDVMNRFQESTGIQICEGYGLTETSPVVCLNVPGATRPGSVGQLIPECSVKIISDEGQTLPPNEEGEILIAGHNIMQGYFKMPELTDQVIRPDGYFITGDWGKIDDDGYLYITGRKKEMLIISGENVFPREIEEVLNNHPAVHSSAVIGRQDPSRGEVPIAFLQLQEDSDYDEKDLRAHCRSILAGFKIPKEFIILDELPRNPTGKIMRRELKDPAKESEPATT